MYSHYFGIETDLFKKYSKCSSNVLNLMYSHYFGTETDVQEIFKMIEN